MIARVCLFVIVVATSHVVFAQLPPGPLIQSPNAATLGAFGEIPVSYNTGTPDISIPIYTLSSGSINVPVTLSYHQGSVRPNEHPGWVGLGWSLESAGTISRVVHHFPDEITEEGIGGLKNYYDYGRFSIAASDWNSPAKLLSYYSADQQGLITDPDPDEFSFSFLGYSGSFYLTSSGWKAVSDTDVKVEVNSFIREGIEYGIAAGLPNFTGLTPAHRIRQYFQFTLTTEDGTKYIFGGQDAGGTTAVDYTAGYGKSIEGYTIDTWHLIRAIDRDGHTIDFKYHRKYPICSLSFSASDMQWDCIGPGGGSGFTSQNISMTRHGGTAIFPVYLDEIIGETAKVKFITSSTNSTTSNELRYSLNFFKYSEDGLLEKEINPTWLRTNTDQAANYEYLSWEKLDEIQIKSSNGTSITNYGFEYSNSTTQRLTLLSLKEKHPTDAFRMSKIYSFGYNIGVGFPDLPAYGGDKTDHWGYFNDRSIDGLSFAQLQAASVPNKNKIPNPSVVTAGLLNKIVYPTGGYTEFEWEAHVYSKVLGTSKVALDNEIGNAGGCRIKEIRSYTNSTATPVKKTYYYLSNYAGSTAGLSSSGVLSGRPQYFIGLTQRPTATGQHTLSYSRSAANSTVSYGSITQGSPIGYTEVVEKNSDDSYTKYIYTGYGPDIYGVSHFDVAPVGTIGWLSGEDRFIPFSSLARERGKLLQVTQYTNTSQPVMRTQYTYNNDPSRLANPVRFVELGGLYSCPGNGADALVFSSAYYQYTHRYAVTSETTTQYNPAPDLTASSITKSYSYNAHGLISEKNTTQSDGTTNQTVYKYTGDFDNSTYINNCNTSYSTCASNASTTLTQCIGACGGNQSCISGCQSANSGMMAVCSANLGQCLNAYPNTNAIISLKNNHILSSIVEEQSRIVYPNSSKVLTKGNLNIFKYFGTSIRAGDFYTLEPTTAFADLTQASVGPSGALTYHSQYKPAGNVDAYDASGNIIQLHKTDGIRNSYIWGHGKTRMTAEVTNTTANNIFFESFEETGTWDANLTGLDNTKAHTGTSSGKIVKATAGEQTSTNTQWLSILSSTTARRLKYSGWVYSDGPSADLYLLMKTPSESSAYTYLDKVTTTVTGKWVYVEGEYTVPGNISKVALRIDNNGSGTVWFDDLRLHPSEARMKTYTYDPLTMFLSSQTDINNIPTYFEYDTYRRLKLIRDQNGNILKHYQYHYQYQY